MDESKYRPKNSRGQRVGLHARPVIYSACRFQVVLVKSREQVAEELSRLQRDNESLQGKHRLHVELQQQEDFQMPGTVLVRGSRRPSSTSAVI